MMRKSLLLFSCLLCACRFEKDAGKNSETSEEQFEELAIVEDELPINSMLPLLPPYNSELSQDRPTVYSDLDVDLDVDLSRGFIQFLLPAVKSFREIFRQAARERNAYVINSGHEIIFPDGTVVYHGELNQVIAIYCKSANNIDFKALRKLLDSDYYAYRYSAAAALKILRKDEL